MIRVVTRFVRVLRVVLAAAAAAAVVGVDAAPAWAHGVSGVHPTNYRTTIRGIEPAVPGLTLRSVDLGGKLQLTNRTATDAVVLGYQGEPYLRVGPRGVYENAKSPAVFLNRTTIPRASAPSTYDPKAAPQWRKISSSRTARWHDHRAHWMGGGAPPQVTRDPGHSHVVIAGWQVPITYGARQLHAVGDVTWVPGPSVLPWVGVAVVLALVLIAASRTRVWPAVLGVALALLVAGEAMHVAGLWGASSASAASNLGASVYSIAGCAVGVGALAVLARRGHDPYDATPMVLIGAVFLLVAGGFADVTSITRSQIPSTLPDVLARGVVTNALGIGGGLVVAAALRLRRPHGPPHRKPPERRRRAGTVEQVTGPQHVS
jgi:hypothetical protein